jgi:hypothetical protein
MDISNLFPAGPIIDEEHQIGRLSSIEGMTDWLRAGDVIRVFDRRRWGKSSVARAALTRLQTEGLITVRLALDEYPTPAAAAAVLAEASALDPNGLLQRRVRWGLAWEVRFCVPDRQSTARRSRLPAASYRVCDLMR